MNNEAENNLLAIMLLYEEKQPYIFEKCKKEFFMDATNRKIFEIALKLYGEGSDIDNVSIFEESNKNKLVGNKVMELLTDNIAESYKIKTYCNIVAKNYVDRLIKEAKTVEDFEEIESIKTNFLTFSEEKIKHISDGVENFIPDYEKQKNKAIITCYDELDKYIGSLQGGDYIALGGSTGSGKTAFALNIAKFVCCQDKHVLYCSLEMPLKQLQNRFACLTVGLSANKFRSVGFTKEELKQYQDALNSLQEWNLNVICDYNLTLEKLKIYATEQAKKGLDFLIIDYLGLLSGHNNMSAYERTTILSRKIKLLATELNIPVLVLVQLNRESKKRAVQELKRPMLSDIRDSGAIEQDADIVLFTYRPCVDILDKFEAENRKNEFEILIAKNRHGETNKKCTLFFDLSTQEIRNNDNYYGFPNK